MSSVIYATIGENRGRPRIYVQGRKLTRAGYKAGDRYIRIASPEKQAIVLKLCINGDKKISQKNNGETPVIDINAHEIDEVFRGAKRVRITIRTDRITITLHHLDQVECERVARLLGKLKNGEPLNVGSLAHGGGVLDLAFHRGLNRAKIPCRLSFAVEVEDKYLEASLANNPVWDEKTVAILGKMEEVEFHLLPKSEVMVAGIPCTGASLSGLAKNGLKAAEEHETAGALFVAFLMTIQAVQPAIILLENVPPYANTLSMVVIRNVLEHLGYALQERIIDGMGALENRNRFVMVAASHGLNFDFDLDAVMSIREREPNVNAILEPVPLNSSRWKSFEYLEKKQVRDLASGKGFRRQLLTGVEEQCGTIGRGYAKCRSTEPFLLHPQDKRLSRLLTPKEHARVKTIDECLIEGVSETSAHEILGQSVIAIAFEAIAWQICLSLLNAANDYECFR